MTARLAFDGGFQDESIESARAFRLILDALARPGRIATLPAMTPPAPLSSAAATVLLTLADSTTPVFLAPAHRIEMVEQWVRFHTSAPLVSSKAEAVFALGTWDDLDGWAGFPTGTELYPDRSATLIVEQASLQAEGVRLTGPGIETEAFLSLPEVEAFKANSSLYPLGLDFFFCSGNQLAGLPRSTQVEAR